MLGPGVYVSQDINKARAYGDGTILTVRVVTGVVKMITGPQDRDGTWQVGGQVYDSAWVKPGVQPSGEEHCVRDSRRIKVLKVNNKRLMDALLQSNQTWTDWAQKHDLCWLSFVMIFFGDLMLGSKLIEALIRCVRDCPCV